MKRKHRRDYARRGVLPAKYTLSVAVLILIILILYYYNTTYLPNVQAQEKQPKYLEQHMNQIMIGANTPSTLTNIPHYCLAVNVSTACNYHWHIHLDILVNQSSYVVIPNLLGHIDNSTYNLSAIHTHDYSGIIHIECCSPSQNVTFYLGDVFAVWGYPVFDSTDCLTYHGQPVSVYIDGHIWNTSSSGAISNVPILEHEEIAITIGTNPVPASQVPSEYNFPQGF
jgi:hypothetical protein